MTVISNSGFDFNEKAIVSIQRSGRFEESLHLIRNAGTSLVMDGVDEDDPWLNRLRGYVCGFRDFVHDPELEKEIQNG